MFKRSDKEFIFDMIIEWREITKTRDKIIHFYFGVSLSVIWDIITADIPLLKDKLKNLAKSEDWEIWKSLQLLCFYKGSSSACLADSPALSGRQVSHFL